MAFRINGFLLYGGRLIPIVELDVTDTPAIFEVGAEGFRKSSQVRHDFLAQLIGCQYRASAYLPRLAKT